MGDRWTIEGTGPIAIARDEHGVPHVRATAEVDLYRGLGFCHATDRALAMLLARILGTGRAAECLDGSDETVAIDRFFRRLNLAGDVGVEAGRLDAPWRDMVAGYCAGVNEALAARVPWELRLLGFRPEPWTPADCVLLSRMIGYVALAQSQGDMERLLVEMVQGGVAPGLLAELFPIGLERLDPSLVRAVELGERLVPDGLRWQSAVPRAMASNNWVLSGRKTVSGFPLLANDPHLETNRLPAVWYEIVLEQGERFCLAATVPGLPGALLGRTNDLAWGATYTFMDAVDSWIEDCRDGAYRRVTAWGETWVPFRTRAEVIRRRGKAPITVTFHENEHGVLDGEPTGTGLRLATRWASGAGTGAASTAAIMGMLHALDVPEGMRLLGRIETAWNWVLADRHGHIGYQMSGCMPRRAPGRSGLVPLPGWDPENDWQGLVPAAELPSALDPESGFLVTANDDLNHLGRAHPINLPMGAYRAERIRELLAARDDWDVVATERLHMDVLSPQALRFMTVLRPLLPDTPEGRTLREWDGRYDLASRGAVLFERFYRALLVEVFGAQCGPTVMRFLTEETGIVADFYANFDAVLLRAESGWYGAEGRDAIWTAVAARAVVAPVPTWGETRSLWLRHLLLGRRLPAWLGFDHGPVPLPGGRATIHQGQLYRSGGRETSFAPSFRLVTDLAEAAAWTSLAGGPSDRRFSRWYTSGLADWRAGRGKRVAPRGG